MCIDDCGDVCNVLDQVDRLHRDHVPHRFRQPDGPCRERSWVRHRLDDPRIGVFVAGILGHPDVVQTISRADGRVLTRWYYTMEPGDSLHAIDAYHAGEEYDTRVEYFIRLDFVDFVLAGGSLGMGVWMGIYGLQSWGAYWAQQLRRENLEELERLAWGEKGEYVDDPLMWTPRARDADRSVHLLVPQAGEYQVVLLHPGGDEQATARVYITVQGKRLLEERSLDFDPGQVATYSVNARNMEISAL